MSGQEHGRRSSNPSNSGSHNNSLPSIRDVFPGAFDYAHGDPRARVPGHPAPLPPLQHPVPPYPQPHAQAPYLRGGPSSSMHSPPPPPPMPRSNYYDPSSAPGLMPRAPAPLTSRPYSATRPYVEQRPPHHAPAMPMQTPPAPTMRPPQPPAAGAMPGGTFIKLGPSSSGNLVINAQSDNPRGLSKIGNLQFEPSDPAEGRHVCDRCGRQFDRPSTLRTHMNAHDGNKPFACPKCGRGFGASSNMRRHERRCRKGQGSTGTDPQSPSSVSSGSSRS